MTCHAMPTAGLPARPGTAAPHHQHYYCYWCLVVVSHVLFPSYSNSACKISSPSFHRCFGLWPSVFLAICMPYKKPRWCPTGSLGFFPRHCISSTTSLVLLHWLSLGHCKLLLILEQTVTMPLYCPSSLPDFGRRIRRLLLQCSDIMQKIIN
jgi:hypothetical protein